MTNLVFVRGEDLLLRVSIRTIELAPYVPAVILVSVIRIWEFFPGNDACPGIVYVNVAGVVEHVGGEAAWRTHVHFQGDLLARLVLVENSKWKNRSRTSKASSTRHPRACTSAGISRRV